MRVQRPAQELRLEIRAGMEGLSQQLRHAPGPAELAARLAVTEEEVQAARLTSARAFQVASLDAPLSSEPGASSLSDLVGDEDPDLLRVIDLVSVWHHCAELPAREQRLLMMRFYGNMTQQQIARQLGASQMHVSRLLGRALAYLRERLTDTAVPDARSGGHACG